MAYTKLRSALLISIWYKPMLCQSIPKPESFGISESIVVGQARTEIALGIARHL